MEASISSTERRRRLHAAATPPIVIFVGFLVLIGWQFEIPVFTSLFQGLKPMNPAAAVTFMLAGISLWLLSKRQALYLARLFALILTFLTAIKLFGLLFGRDVGLDWILFPEKMRASIISADSAPNAAFIAFLFAVALYLSNRNSARLSVLAQALALLGTSIAVLALIGYFFNANTFYGISSYSPMALNAALTFVVLGVGIFSIQPDVGIVKLWRSSSTGGTLMRRLLPLIVAAPLIIDWSEGFIGRYISLDTVFSTALFACIDVLFFGIIIGWTAYKLDRSDRERKRIETALRESEARYRSLFESSSDAIMIFDEYGRYHDANQQAEQLSGYSREEILSKHMGEFAANPAVGRAAFEEVQRAGQVLTDYVIKRKDGSELTVELSTRRITPTLYQTIVHDISERKKAEENLLQALEQERQLNELKSRFVSLVSHEFRTPLSIIQSSTDLLLLYGEKMDMPKRRQRLEKIQHQVEHLVQMLNDMLIIRKAETVGVDFHPEVLDLRDFCVSLIAEVQSAMFGHQIVFNSSGDCSQVAFDPNLLRHAISNLLTNAAKYSPGQDTVRFEIVCGEKEIILCVQDRGIGIPKEDQEHLFEVFHRGRNVADISGTGLGLTIVKQAIDAHGGTIRLESAENNGTTFMIQLPRQRSA